MLQRIQTIYLIIIVILAGFCIFLPTANLTNTNANSLFLLDFRGISLVKAGGNTLISTTWGLVSLVAAYGIISTFTIFSYKNRVKQIRLSVINMLFMIAYYPTLAFYIWDTCRTLNTDWHLQIASILPLICLIFNYLAIGAIGKDEALVKSLDRLR